MEETKDKLSKPIKPPGAPVGIRARRDIAPPVEKKDLSSFPNRIALIFDDSGSMGSTRMSKAKEAVGAFAQAVNPKDTAIAIYPFWAPVQPLTDSMSQLYLYTAGIQATGGTPILRTINQIMQDNTCNKIILFSDGSPDTRTDEDLVIKMLNAKEIIVDTVLIENDFEAAIDFMKNLAEKTNGIFLKFTDASVFGKNLKYLTPGLRLMLADKSFKDKIEKGEV